MHPLQFGIALMVKLALPIALGRMILPVFHSGELPHQQISPSPLQLSTTSSTVSDSLEPTRQPRASRLWPLRRREDSIDARSLSLTALSGQLRTTSSRYRSNAKAESNICQASAKYQ